MTIDHLPPNVSRKSHLPFSICQYIWPKVTEFSESYIKTRNGRDLNLYLLCLLTDLFNIWNLSPEQIYNI